MHADTSSTPEKPDSPVPDPEAGLLAACPLCDYALRGLPIAHRCPECGFAIDRRWEVHGGRSLVRASGRRWHLGKFIALNFGGVVVIWMVAIRLLPIPRGPRYFLTALLTVALVVVIWVTTYRPRQFIAVGPDGLVIVRSRKRIERYGWPEVGRARYDLLRKSVAFKHGDTEVRMKMFNFFGSNITAVDACVRAINAYPRPH